MHRPVLNDPNEMLVGNLIIETRKQHPSVAAHVIHDLYLNDQVKVDSTGRINLHFKNGIVYGSPLNGYAGTIR